MRELKDAFGTVTAENNSGRTPDDDDYNNGDINVMRPNDRCFVRVIQIFEIPVTNQKNIQSLKKYNAHV